MDAQPRAVPGVRLGTAAAGIRYPGRDDLVIVELPAGASTAAVFTRNRFRAAPVRLAEAHLDATPPRYLLVNSGCANAGTGAQGETDALACCRALAARAGCAPEEVLPFSTGVIGESLPVARIEAALDAALGDRSETGWSRAAVGIHTTDTRSKIASTVVQVGETGWVVTGMAKGAGMIRPDMATMLAYVATDAGLTPELADRVLRDAVGTSFNRVTVDGDTSTNDAAVLVASGTGATVTEGSEALTALSSAVEAVCVSLAQQIAADGEGATRLVEVCVEGARSVPEAEGVAFTVAESPLVKTALAAADPNWGRILAAVGRAGIDDLDIAGVDIRIGEVPIVCSGQRADDYDEARATGVLEGERVPIHIGLSRGEAAATVWTCDLTAEYVRINAEYRT